MDGSKAVVETASEEQNLKQLRAWDPWQEHDYPNQSVMTHSQLRNAIRSREQR